MELIVKTTKRNETKCSRVKSVLCHVGTYNRRLTKHCIVQLCVCVCVCVCVLVEPQFAASHQTTAYAWAGRHRNVTCVVLAEPDVVIEWLRGGRLINTNYTFSTVQTRSWQTSVSYLQVNEILQTASAQNILCTWFIAFHFIGPKTCKNSKSQGI